MKRPASAVADVYARQFRDIAPRLPGLSRPWNARLRERGLARFLQLGFPSTQLEEWRFTNVEPIRNTPFRPGFQATDAMDAAAAADHCALRLHAASYPQPRMVFVNGIFDAELSGGLDAARSTFPGLQLLPLAEALERNGGGRAAPATMRRTIQRRMGRHAVLEMRAFAAWNTAFFTDGASIHIPDGAAIPDPIYLIFLSFGGGAPWASQPRIFIAAGEASQVTVAAIYMGIPGMTYLTNSVTEIDAGAGSVVEYIQIEEESPQAFHIAAVSAELAADAAWISHSVSSGGALVRNDLDVALEGEGAGCTLNGLFVVDDRRLVDNHTRIDHRRPHTSSRELYKGILAGRGQGVFNGAITVREAADRTDAVQHNKNLLLSDHARIHTKPQLEIRASDVRCAHGATIGQIEQDALFYLRSRGLEEGAARRMLMRGFAAPVVDAIRTVRLREHVETRLAEWFAAALEAA